MKKIHTSILRRIIASLKGDLKGVRSTDKPVVFLGGLCEDNKWRKYLKDKYGKDIYFLDPYDKNWKAEDNIYQELEGLLKSDVVVFFRPGEGSKKEKKFLDSLDKDNYKEFSDLDELESYLRKVTDKKYEKVCAETWEPVHNILRSIVRQRLAYPWVGSKDLHFESIDPNTLPDLVQDIKDNEEIHVDSQIKGLEGLEDFSGKEITENMRGDLSKLFLYIPKKHGPGKLIYDHSTHTIKPKSTEVMAKSAKEGQTYDYSSTQVDLPEDLAEKIMALGKEIPDDELYVEDDGGCGREDEIHVTLLYGLKDKDPDEVKRMLKGVKPFDVQLGTTTAFMDDKKYDVLKIDVDSPELQKLHYILELGLPNENSYPTYQPHVTIAYLKKGNAKKYIGDDSFRGKKFKAQEIAFSSKNGEKIPLSLG